MNKVLLEGLVESEPVIRYFNYKHVRADFVLCTEEYFPATDTLVERHIETRHNIRAWGEVAQIIELYIREGQRVRLEGRLTYDRIEGMEGASRSISVVDCNLISILEERQHTPVEEEKPSISNDLDWSSFSPDEEEDPMA